MFICSNVKHKFNQNSEDTLLARTKENSFLIDTPRLDSLRSGKLTQKHIFIPQTPFLFPLSSLNRDANIGNVY